MNKDQQFVALLHQNKHLLDKIYYRYSSRSYEPNDYYQDVALFAWKQFPNFREESKFSTWLYKIAHGVIMYKLRKMYSARFITGPAVAAFYEKAVSEMPETDVRLEKQLRSMRESQAKYLISTLSERDQELVILYASGRSYYEMSLILKDPENVLRVRMHRVKERLRRKFGSR